MQECVNKNGFEACLKNTALDKGCHEDYANKLIPKAIGYSAGVMNYFFRGTLEISMPDRYVYSIADGSLDPQKFNYIKAKVKNTSKIGDITEEMAGGQEREALGYCKVQEAHKLRS